MSNGEYKDLIAFRTDRQGKKKPVRLGYVKTTPDGKTYIQFDTLPAGNWWDGSVIISERREDNAQRGGGGGGRGGFGGQRPAFGADAQRDVDDSDIPF